MPHELEKLDDYLEVPKGTSYYILINHTDPKIINDKLKPYNIQLDEYGMILEKCKKSWKQLMIKLSIDKKYWKDKDDLIENQVIETL